MRSKILGALIAFTIAAGLIQAANITITFTAGQNTYTQNTLIPAENADKCARYSTVHPLPGCTTAQLTSPNGTCVAAAFSAVTLDNLVYRDCTIYTQDAAGEALFHADQLYKHEVANVSNDLAADVTATKAAWVAASTANKNTACTTIGRPNGCHFFQ